MAWVFLVGRWVSITSPVLLFEITTIVLKLDLRIVRRGKQRGTTLVFSVSFGIAYILWLTNFLCFFRAPKVQSSHILRKTQKFFLI